MGSLVALLGMLSAFVLWLFFKFQPLTPQVKILRVTSRLFLGLAVLMAVLWVLRVYTTYTDPFTDRLVTQLAAAGAMGFFVVIVGLGFVIRNFIVFRAPRF